MAEGKVELVGKLFYLLTVMLEEGVAVASEGQACADPVRFRELTRRLRDCGQAVIILSDTAQWLLECEA